MGGGEERDGRGVMIMKRERERETAGKEQLVYNCDACIALMV